MTGGRHAVLHIHLGAHETTVAPNGGDDERRILTLGIGTHRTADDFLARTPTSPAALERAIAAIEDAVERARPLAAGRRVVLTGDAVFADVARRAGAGNGPLTLEAVEQRYQEIANAAMGAAAPGQAAQWDRRQTATVVILRELMHHLGLAEAAVEG